jgi:septal ring factor EnvC (AmiA/AmiB activator)
MKLFDSFIKFGKGFANLPNIGRYAVVFAALYFAFIFGGTKKETQFSKFKAEYQQVLKKADTLTKLSDSLETKVQNLQKSVVKKDSTINRLTITVEWRARQNRALSSDLAELEVRMQDSSALRDTAQLLALKDSAIINLKEQVSNRDSILVQKDSIIQIQQEQKDTLTLAIKLSEQRGDSLEAFIRNLPPTPKDPDKFLGVIKKPSRKTVAVVSFVSGVIATVFAVK